ncbi:hypothetical protein [Bradymonas sediminis]|uniref:hypothetical protein n=1 Tax=Bradymonas sediminis TaxID=1548548 RepID=UPI00105BA1DF|nr:hypothetical protein [Bradymonas sediminis]TDP75998.1 hypothetical protein DFR33_103347 [Bradymonas sediminis]
MRRIWVLSVLVLMLFAVACSDDSADANNGGGADVTAEDANGAGGDASGSDATESDAQAADTREEPSDSTGDDATGDASVEPDGDGEQDVTQPEDVADDVDVDVDVDSGDAGPGEDTGDASSEDVADTTDPNEDPYEGRPPGQCTSTSECPGEFTMCHLSFPGGSCATCASDADCPSGRACNQYGACVTECDSDEECPLGLYCLGSGQCAAVRCADDSDCPALYACGDTLNQCERIDCSADASVCPSGTTCSSGRCMEDRQL